MIRRVTAVVGFVIISVLEIFSQTPNDNCLKKINNANIQCAMGNWQVGFENFQDFEKECGIIMDYSSRLNFLNVCLVLRKDNMADKQLIELLRMGGRFTFIGRNYPEIQRFLDGIEVEQKNKLAKLYQWQEIDLPLRIEVNELITIDQFARFESCLPMEEIDSVNFSNLVQLPLLSPYNVGFDGMNDALIIALHYGRYNKEASKKVEEYLFSMLVHGAITPKEFAYITEDHRLFLGERKKYGVANGVKRNERLKIYGDYREDEITFYDSNRKEIGFMTIAEEITCMEAFVVRSTQN